jgi:hypothetical protein
MVPILRRRGRALVVAEPVEQAPGIAAQITETEAALAALNSARPAIAFAAIRGVASAEARLAGLDAEIGDAERHLSLLRSAVTEAALADQQMIEQRHADLRAQQIAEVRRLLEARDQAAERLAVAIGEL